MRSSFLSLLALATFSVAAPVNFAVPLSWRKFSDSHTKAERIAISQAGIDQILPQLDASKAEFKGIGYWQSGNVFASIANHDHFAGSDKNKATVLAGINKAYELHAHGDAFQFNDDALWWGTAAYYAFRAYGDKAMLDHATDTWTEVSKFAIKADGKITGTKSFAVAGTCESKPMTGAVFWRSVPVDESVNSITTGLYMTLSAFLATTVEFNEPYKAAAIASATWIRDLNTNNEGIVLDSMNGKTCNRPNNWIFTYNNGKLIEGLAALADVTKDQKWYDLLASTTQATVKTNHWQGADGIITEGASPNENNDGVGFKSAFIRGLNEALVRTQDRDMGIIIHSYIDVQYNALLDLAAKGNSYSSAWHGPAQDFTTWGQMAALDVLVSAISANT